MTKFLRGLTAVKLIALCGLMTLSGASIAGPKCTEEPESKWLTADQMSQKFRALGFQDNVKKLHVSKGKCWEIYGTNVAGEKVEVYFHPISGEIVELNKRD